jgi:hypothetical protein
VSHLAAALLYAALSSRPWRLSDLTRDPWMFLKILVNRGSACVVLLGEFWFLEEI